WEPAWAALDSALQSLQVPGAPSGTWHAQAQALRVLEAQASLAAAAPAAAHWERRRLVALRRAGETLEAASRAYAHPSERGRWLAAHAHLFPQAVAAVWEQAGGQPDPAAIQEAFDLAERARSMNLRQHLLEVEAQHGAGLPPALRAEGQALRREIALLRYQGTTSPEQAWQRAERERQYDWWVTHLRQRFPAFEALYDPAPAREVPLASDQALVTFVATPVGWFRFVRIEDRMEMTRLSLPVAAVDSLVRQCRMQIEARQAAWQETGYALYQTLLGDVEFPASVKRLVLVPEGSLCALPWEVLPTAPSEAGDIPFLVRRFALSYRYAAQLAGRSQAGWSFHRPALLAVQPDFGPGDSLPPLTGTRTEVAAILDIWPGQRLVGTAASEAALRAQAPGYGLIHIATHGLLADTQPWQSWLALAAGGDGAGVDGRLHLYELLDWSLRAELVTLSACHTGMGNWVEGEGMMSLARGFAYAGASSVVMSLWAVPDGPTAELMPAFYAGLRAGLPKDEALRQARLAYLASQPSERQHPYYWGAWVLTGDTAPLSRPLPWGWLAGGLLLIGLGAYGLRARRRAVAGPAGHSSPYGRPNRPG
ncbi:MAG: CHAT domain-containing protein, partial [Bacteroidetes bacterium]